MSAPVTCSYGGAQSTALLVLAAQRQLGIPVWLALFDQPLAQAITEAKPPLDIAGDEGEGGNSACFT